MARPATARSLGEVRSLDGVAYEGHAEVIRLIQDYASKRAGVLPDRVDAATLNVELLASGGSWPEGAYDGQALHDGLGKRLLRCVLGARGRCSESGCKDSGGETASEVWKTLRWCHGALEVTGPAAAAQVRGAGGAKTARRCS